MEIKDLVDNHTFTTEESIIFKLKSCRKNLTGLSGFLKGLQYHKDENINCNWEYDINFINGMIEELLSSSVQSTHSEDPQ